MRYLRLRLRRPSKPTVFAMLMAASLVMVLLPGDPLRPVKNLTQLMAPLQLATLEATRGVTAPLRTLADGPATPEQRAKLLREKQALENENAALRQQMAELQSTIQELTGIRQRGFPPPPRGVLIPARVISLDAAPGRDSLVVGKGHVQKVSQDAWVAWQLEVGAGSDQGVQDACAVLARQCLIGRVQQVAPLTSRVVLFSDRLASRPMRVHVASRNPRDGTHQLLAVKGEPLAFVLEGAGGGRMRIRDIPASLVDGRHLRVGDLVTSSPGHSTLPMAMVIGEIRELNLNRANPVHYDALVRYLYDPRTLRRVFIANLK